MTIDTVQLLREHLQTAIEIEHTRLPPYLCVLVMPLMENSDGTLWIDINEMDEVDEV